MTWSTHSYERPKGLPISFRGRGSAPRVDGADDMIFQSRAGLPQTEPRGAVCAIVGPLATGQNVLEFSQ
jgi:hypothetical protein